jgi:molecular chaperone GrpE
MEKNRFDENDNLNNKDMSDLHSQEEETTKGTDVTDNVSEDEAQEVTSENEGQKELDELKAKYEELNNSHLRLMAEFDNYRKRTLKEKSELIKNGGENALTHLLPVIDDFERALQNMQTSESMEGVKEGVELIYNKFVKYLTQQDVKAIETIGKPFDPDTEEAIAMVPTPAEQDKGLVIDCVQKGYTLHDKVIRHARVVVGE